MNPKTDLDKKNNTKLSESEIKRLDLLGIRKRTITSQSGLFLNNITPYPPFVDMKIVSSAHGTLNSIFMTFAGKVLRKELEKFLEELFNSLPDYTVVYYFTYLSDEAIKILNQFKDCIKELVPLSLEDLEYYSESAIKVLEENGEN